MSEFLMYDLHVAVLIATFYLFWRLLLARETLHRLNRAVLLITAALSFVLPLCVVTLHRSVVVPVAERTTAAMPTATVERVATGQPWWMTAAVAVFLAGALLTLAWTLLSVGRVWRLVRSCELHPQGDGTVVAVTDRDLQPFSWMHYIVMSRSDYDHPDAAILAHERGHISAHHSWDVLLVGVFSVLQWFNPALWLLRRDLRAIHEYEADAAVLSQGIDARQYQYLLVRKAVATHGYSVANSLSHSTLKRRINMMLRKKTNRLQWLRALYIVPVVAISLAVSARTVVDYQMQLPAPAKAEVKATAGASSLVLSNADQDNKVKDNRKKVRIPDEATNAHPLVIVNGAEMPYDRFVEFSPNIVKSITVLKDEEGRKKYGAKAKDGVIVVEIEDQPNKKGHEPFKVKGQVVDEQNQPVIGATVMVKGTKQGTVTDMDGNFSIVVPDGATIEAAYIGMATSSVKADRAVMAPKEGSECLVNFKLKKDGSDAVPTAKATSKIVTRVVVDGKEMSMEEFETTTEPDNIESMSIDKTDPKHIKIKVSTKK